MQDRHAQTHIMKTNSKYHNEANQNANIVTSGRFAWNWCVVLGVHFIFWPIRKHVDKIIQVPQTIGQRPDGEVSGGERHQIPEHSFL